MRVLTEELTKIIEFARNNDNIRALVLQGSYVNDNAILDEFSDLDPLFFVRDVDEFVLSSNWKSNFGISISSFDDEGESHDGHKWFTRLTIFSDGFKIDFGFQSIELAKYANEMSLYKIFLDKDGIVPKPEVFDERKFYIKKPTEQEFLERVNTFYYDTSYIAKALARNEIFFAKYMESVLQKKVRKIIDWYIGTLYDFKVNTGVQGRYFRRYLDDETWSDMLKTYANGDRINMANALFATYYFVGKLGRKISQSLKFDYPEKHESNMLNYCHIILDKVINDIS